MLWFKHLSGMGRSPAMSELRGVLGLAGYGAFWLLMERIAESWDAPGEPELCLPEREWRVSCGFSAKKFQILTEILQKHDIIRMKKCHSLLCINAHILMKLKDEFTRKLLKKSGETPESFRSHSGTQTDIEPDVEKDKKTRNPTELRRLLLPVLKRYGIQADSERGRNLLRYVEAKQAINPGGYLQGILKKEPNFDPAPSGGRTEYYSQQTIRQQGPCAVGDILRDMNFSMPLEKGD